MIATARRYFELLPVYARETATVGDFLRLLQARLSQSKIGRVRVLTRSSST